MEKSCTGPFVYSKSVNITAAVYPPTPSAVERAGTLNDIILTLQQTGIMDLEQATQVS
jgi:hypothetical protein